MSEISIPINTQTFLGLAAFLQKMRSDLDPVVAVECAIDYWMENAEWKPDDLIPGYVEFVPERISGYQWKQLFLPHGTKIRMKYKGVYYYANILNDAFVYDDIEMSPGEFANRVTRTSRNAWRDLEIWRPADKQWVLADVLRSRK